MGVFFVYILKAAVCLSVFYLFYRLLLSRETFHRFNRIAVLSILVLSLLIPFCEVKVKEQTEVHQTVLSLEQLLLLADMMEEAPVVEAQSKKVVWVHIVLYIYLAGILIFACRNIYSLIRLGLLLKSGKREKLDSKITLIIHDKNDLAPFSWMKYIVISRKDLEENGREILIHELAHIHKRHSIDLLVADICIFSQWFNPAAWLLKQELQTIHEYEADETVIKEGIDAKQYQLLLIKKAVGTRLYSMANSFNHSKLKKRITMMLKEKSSPWARLKYLYVLPLAAIAVTAFARPEVSNELKEISKVKVNDLAVIVEVNEKESITEEVDSVLLIHGTPAQKYKEDGTVSHIEVMDDADPSYTMVASEQIVESVKEGQDIAEVMQLTDVNSLHISNGTGVLDTTKPESEADKILKIGFKENKVNVLAGRMSYKADNIKFSKPQGIHLHGVKDGKEPLFIINGKEADYSILSALNPESIESINVLKDMTSTEIYGKRGENGVVIITLKSAKEQVDAVDNLPLKGRFAERTKSYIKGNPIIILDGKEIDSIESIDPETIKLVSVLKDISGANEEEKELFTQYGEKAKDGFVLIKSKTPDDNTGIQLIGVQRKKKIVVDGIVTDESNKTEVIDFNDIKGNDD